MSKTTAANVRSASGPRSVTGLFYRTASASPPPPDERRVADDSRGVATKFERSGAHAGPPRTRTKPACLSEHSLIKLRDVVRATPLPPDERRAAIITATAPLLRERGREISTREIAEAAGIAEGTIFRVFASKEELIDAVIDDAFDPTSSYQALAGNRRHARPGGAGRRAVTIIQHRLQRVFGLVYVLGFRHPAVSDAASPRGPRSSRPPHSPASWLPTPVGSRCRSGSGRHHAECAGSGAQPPAHAR